MQQSGMTFEYAINKLRDITERLENGQETLEGSMKLYQSGMELAKYCEDFLNEAEQKVIVINPDVTNREGE